MEKILPIANPSLTTFPGYANALAILESCEKARDWVYSQYIQIAVVKIKIRDLSQPYYPTAGYAPCFFADFDKRRIANTLADGIFLNRETCPFLNIFEIPISILKQYTDDYCALFKKCIDNNMYIYAHTEVSKIKLYGIDPPESSDDIKEYDHPIMIYGYSDDTKTFCFADFIRDSRYNFVRCSYKEIQDAFIASESTFLPMVKSISLIQVYENGSFTFDLQSIKDAIIDYVNPDQKLAHDFTKYADSFFAPLNWKASAVIGSEVYSFLSEFIDKTCEEYDTSGIIDIRPFHALFDHKQMMYKRLEYFIQKGYVSKSKESILSDYCSVVNSAKIVRNMVLKYRLNGDHQIPLRIKDIIARIKIEEKVILNAFFDL